MEFQDYAIDEALPLLPAPWLSLSSTTWAMDMITAFVCGLGLFHVFIYYFHFTSPSPALGTTTTYKKVVKRDHNKARKKIRTLKAYRHYSRKKEKDNKFLLSLLRSMLEKLTDTISFCQLLRSDTSAAVPKPEAGKEHQPPRHLTQESTATNAPLVASLPLLKEHLLPKDLTLSPVLLNPLASKESQSFMCASRPPVTLIPEMHSSQAPCGPTSPTCPQDPVPCSLSKTDPSMTLPPPPPPPPPPLPPLRCNWKTRVTSQSTPLPGLPSPIPSTPGHELSNRPITGTFWYKEAARIWCHSNSSQGETLQENHSLSFQEASFWKDPRHRLIEAGEPPFINPDVQEMLELQISKRVGLKLWKGREKDRSAHSLSYVGDLLQSWSREQAVTYKPEQFSGHQQLLYKKVLGNNVQQDCRQLFWGLPFLHSESLMVTVSIAGSPLDPPSILFNGLSTYNSIQVERSVPSQLTSPKPLLQHLVESQPLTANLSWPCSPVSEIKTQAYDPSSPPSQPPHPSPTKDCKTSCPTATRSQFIVPPAIQCLEKYLLKKYQESRNDLPDMVKKSQEIFNQLTSNSLVSQGQGSVPHVLEEFSHPELEEQWEQCLNNSCGKHGGHTIQLSPDLTKAEDKLPGMGHAEDNQGISCSSARADESSQHLHRLSSKDPEIVQIGKDPCRDLTESPGGSQSELHRIAEGSLGKGLETLSATEVENCCVRQPSDSPSPQPGAPGDQQLQGLLRRNSSEWGCYDDSTVPVGTCCETPVDSKMVPPKNSETHMEDSERPMEDSEIPMENSETNFKNPETNMEPQTSFKDTSTGLPFLDPSTQQVLDTHLTRRLVKHRWILPLRGLKTIQLFNMSKPVALPFPQSPTPSWTCWDSRDDSTVKTASILGEPFQKGLEEDLKTKTASGTKTPPAALCLQLPNRTLPNDNLWPSEVPSTVQKDNVTSLCTTSPSNKVLRCQNDNPEPGSNLVKSGCEPRKNEGVARDLSRGLSVQEITVASQLATTREARELEEEEEESCGWALNMETREMANSQTNNGGLKSLQTSKGQSPSQTTFQDAEDSAPDIILQDYATGICFQGCSPDILLAADILASQPPQTSFKTVSTTSITSSKDIYPFLSKGNVPKNPKPEKPWTSHIFGPTDKKEDWRDPRQDLYLSELRPAQAYRADTHESNLSPLTEKTFGGRVKNFMKDFMSAITTKSQVPENSLQKVKASAAMPQSQGSVMSRVLMTPQVAEAQGLMPSVRPILQEKAVVGPARSASKKSLHKEPPQAPVSPHVCLRRSATAERSETLGNNPKVHRRPSTHKWMDYNSQALLCREAVCRANNACQHRVQLLCVPGIPVHCPRHCLCRSECPH
ncbi:spermatogenesis-associated protein 31E1-like [Mus caroli]|uniref:Spermatogenesis-associated protein 31E1-like n=1 Tax=Mus caroli TaxID=10089 RepID=A0A6P5QVL4_MUSCR|nr:spermatogenesis-associated protein 31E1-like [Mus caroli]